MLGFLLDCFNYKNARIGNDKNYIDIAVADFSNSDVEELFNYLKNFNGEAFAIFPVKFLGEFDAEHSYSIKFDKDLMLEKFIDSFYLAKLFSNFVFDEDEYNVPLRALAKKFDEISSQMPNKKSFEELIFNALNDYDMWSTEFYRDFASFEQFVRYHAVTGKELKVWFDDYTLIFNISKYTLAHSIYSTLIQNIIYVIKEQLLLFDSDRLDEDWECIDLEVALYEDGKIVKAAFKECSIYEIAKLIFDNHNNAIILELCSVRFKYEDEPTYSNMSCTC